MLTAFFLKDELNGKIIARSNYEATPSVDGNYTENVSDPRPRVMWSSGMDNLSYASSFTNFCVDQQSRYIELSATASGSITTITVPFGSYTGSQLATEITAQLAASTYSGWSCGYDAGTGKFTLGGSPALYIRWKTGSHGSGGDKTNMGAELGFDTSADDGPTLSISGDESRWGTHTWISFDLEATPTVGAFLCDLYAGVSDAADTSNVTMYGGSSLLTGTFLANVQSGASYTLPFSAEPSEEENKVRVAYHSSGEAKARYWLFSWRHFDEEKRHGVKIVRGMSKTSSLTRTVTTLRGHGLVSAQRGLGINNYYPVENLRRWSLPLAFDSWGETDYRNVIHGVVRYGKQDGFLWALRWDDILSGAVNAEDEADRGFLVYAALHDYSRDTYVGQAAEYLSGELKLEQVR
tara:strand:+ start:327 stop:1550 length:1224 start_codon:yes stop_codon:yes gene_type:complete